MARRRVARHRQLSSEAAAAARGKIGRRRHCHLFCHHNETRPRTNRRTDKIHSRRNGREGSPQLASLVVVLAVRDSIRALLHASFEDTLHWWPAGRRSLNPRMAPLLAGYQLDMGASNTNTKTRPEWSHTHTHEGNRRRRRRHCATVAPWRLENEHRPVKLTRAPRRRAPVARRTKTKPRRPLERSGAQLEGPGASAVVCDLERPAG